MSKATSVYFPNQSLGLYSPGHPKLIYHEGDTNSGNGGHWTTICKLTVFDEHRWKMTRVRLDTAEFIGWACGKCFPR